MEDSWDQPGFWLRKPDRMKMGYFDLAVPFGASVGNSSLSAARSNCGAHLSVKPWSRSSARTRRYHGPSPK